MGAIETIKEAAQKMVPDDVVVDHVKIDGIERRLRDRYASVALKRGMLWSFALLPVKHLQRDDWAAMLREEINSVVVELRYASKLPDGAVTMQVGAPCPYCDGKLLNYINLETRKFRCDDQSHDDWPDNAYVRQGEEAVRVE